MSNKENEGMELKQPKTKWNKPVKIKLKLFKNLFNLVKDIFTKNWLKIPTDVMDTWSGIELVTEQGEKGWQLVTRALSGAMLKLVQEHKHDIDVQAVVSDDLDKNLNKLLESETHFMSYDFFDNPKDLPLLPKVEPVFADFLECVGFDKIAAANISRRLPAYFVLALMAEWRGRAGHYQELEAYLKTPFDKEGLKEKEWIHYLAWLKKQVDEPVFDESFSLKQIYIPLRAYYKEKAKDDKVSMQEPAMGPHKDEVKRIAVDLEEELGQWLDRGDKDDAFRVVTGGPGFGKSSFLKILAAKLAEQHKKVLFVPLHRFKIKDDLKEAITNFVGDDGYLKQSPLGEEPLIIIFDGLDELAMQGKVLADAANEFIREIKTQLSSLNNKETRLQVIVSGRDIIVQSNESQFRKPKQIVHILPYLVSKDKRKKYTDKNDILKDDQRDRWWRNYGGIEGKEYDGLPNRLKTEDLDKLTAQPLLNYLVALSVERGKVDFSEETNLNEIYEDLLKAVYERSYEGARVLKPVEHLKYAEFVRILEEIAISAWHGDSRKTTVKEIQSHCQSSGLGKLLEPFKKEAGKGMVSFLTAFYFRQADHDACGDETFEFTHKSFGEFLAARRIVNRIQHIHKKHVQLKEDYEDGWDIKKCLVEWARLFGPKVLDYDLQKFIANEIKTGYQNDKAEFESIQRLVIQLIDHMLRNGMPMEELGGSRPVYFIENQRAINGEKALLIILGTIAGTTDIVSGISWPHSTAFGEWISRLNGQREGGEEFILKFLNHLDASGAVLHIKDFYGANFYKSNLSKVQMNLANLIDANLFGANLRDANLIDANLFGANLRDANLSGANLSGANLSGANLIGANLIGANLIGANLIGAYLRGANLSGADLSCADLSGATLKKKQLKDAKVDERTKLPWKGKK